MDGADRADRLDGILKEHIAERTCRWRDGRRTECENGHKERLTDKQKERGTDEWKK